MSEPYPDRDWIRARTCVNALAGISDPERAIAAARDALAIAERYLYDTPLEGAIDAHAQVRAALALLEHTK